MLIITGAPRNGLSLLAQYLIKLGYIASANAGPKTAFEDPTVAHINNDILKAAGCAWNHAPNGTQFIANGVIEYRIAKYLNENDDIDFLKDPRFTFTHPIWQRAVKDLDLLVSFREPGEAALSIKSIFGSYVNQALSVWQQYYVRLASVNAAFVEFGGNIEYEDYEENIGRAFGFLEIEHYPNVLSKIYDPHMIHITNSTAFPPPIKNLYNVLLNRKEN